MHRQSSDGLPKKAWRKKLNLNAGRKNVEERGRKGRARKRTRKHGYYKLRKLERERLVRERRIKKLLSKGRMKRPT